MTKAADNTKIEIFADALEDMMLSITKGAILHQHGVKGERAAALLLEIEERRTALRAALAEFIKPMLRVIGD